MNIIDTIVQGYVKEAKIDYIGLWMVAAYFQKIVKIESVVDIKTNSLIVAKKLIEHDILPGQMRKTGGFDFWPGTPTEQLARISAEWPRDGLPTLGSADCWFCLKKE